MAEYLEGKPWRAPKVKQLKYIYRPWKDSYLERFRDEEDNAVCLYSLPGGNGLLGGWERTRVEDLWSWPWLWSKAKVERLSWIHKVFFEDVDAVTVQEHMEMDNLYAEYDLVYRWSTMRIFEMNTFNLIALNLVYFTEFNGVKPTDLGLRPDGTLLACPVQFHNCISSSNSPADADHYAPPIKWSRSKSPEQAYDELKGAYTNYPKRGLKYSSGWIDRGGWFPQQFGGRYFAAQAKSLTWNFVDDVELAIDVDKREVQYRASTRLGQTDWDVSRNRYNQKKGGWEGEPLPMQWWVPASPYRWTRVLLDRSADAADAAAATVGNALAQASTPSAGGGGGGGGGGTGIAVLSEGVAAAGRAVDAATEALAPLADGAAQAVQALRADPTVSAWVDAAAGAATQATDAIHTAEAAVTKFLESTAGDATGLPSLPSLPPLPSLTMPASPAYVGVPGASRGAVVDEDAVSRAYRSSSDLEAGTKAEAEASTAASRRRVRLDAGAEAAPVAAVEAAAGTDVEWVMDALDASSITAPANEAKPVNRRRIRGIAGPPQPQEPLRFDPLEQRVQKAQLDDLRQRFKLGAKYGQ